MSAIYDRLMEASEEACLRAWRADLLRAATGDVLEIGSGTGANLPHFPEGIGRLVLTEPDPHMRRQLETKSARHAVVDAAADRLPFEDAAFDTVVSTLVLCSVLDLPATLSEIHRVLRPGGQLLFLEHVAAEGRPARFWLQRGIEPLWKPLAGNCHLTRRTHQHIEEAGFVLEELTRESMRKALPIVRPTVRGTARKRA